MQTKRWCQDCFNFGFYDMNNTHTTTRPREYLIRQRQDICASIHRKYTKKRKTKTKWQRSDHSEKFIFKIFQTQEDMIREHLAKLILLFIQYNNKITLLLFENWIPCKCYLFFLLVVHSSSFAQSMNGIWMPTRIHHIAEWKNFWRITKTETVRESLLCFDMRNRPSMTDQPTVR